ncbi:hypothetical protein C1Y63_02310 [Corynebacterium sp. 13CS0277]|uniref:hypothetical protein n=1 Tax=Corynebacterium sp. 13CS0277 TaxID=2071994 RepID=UPI000D03F258|nr:hypothetical protein [Corynebacterium sp. 13CS0277]PRQ12165.1 hypothetical protein C1Y63_02310 [Corynebacterium sp. 13CS0277]
MTTHTAPTSLPDAVLVIDDDTLRGHAATTCAAAGLDTTTADSAAELSRAVRTATLAFADDAGARGLRGRGYTGRLYLVAADPHAPNYQLALELHAEGAVRLPSDSHTILDAIARAPATPPGAGTGAGGIVLGVLGGSGGVGASTTAALLARRAARFGPVVLIDAHEHGGALDLLLGLEATDGARWADICGLGSVPDAATMHAALPKTHDDIAVLTQSRTGPAPTIAEQLPALCELAGGLDDTLTIIDAPTGIDLPTTHTLLLAAAELRSLVRTRALLAQGAPGLRVALRHRAWSSTTRDEAEAVLDHPIAATITTHKSIAQRIELAGLPSTLPRSLAATLDGLLYDMGV